VAEAEKIVSVAYLYAAAQLCIADNRRRRRSPLSERGILQRYRSSETSRRSGGRKSERSFDLRRGQVREASPCAEAGAEQAFKASSNSR
jgi:hypothetical protein